MAWREVDWMRGLGVGWTVRILADEPLLILDLVVVGGSLPMEENASVETNRRNRDRTGFIGVVSLTSGVA